MKIDVTTIATFPALLGLFNVASVAEKSFGAPWHVPQALQWAGIAGVTVSIIAMAVLAVRALRRRH